MRSAIILTFLALFPIQQIAAAQEFPKSPSTWQGETRGHKFCLQITEPLVPMIDSRPTPKKCATFSAMLSTSVATSHGDLVSGHFCQDQSQVGFFTLPLPSDNSMSGPNIFLGKLSMNRQPNAAPQALGLADVDHLPLAIAEQVDAGARGQAVELGVEVARGAGGGVVAARLRSRRLVGAARLRRQTEAMALERLDAIAEAAARSNSSSADARRMSFRKRSTSAGISAGSGHSSGSSSSGIST